MHTSCEHSPNEQVWRFTAASSKSISLQIEPQDRVPPEQESMGNVTSQRKTKELSIEGI